MHRLQHYFILKDEKAHVQTAVSVLLSVFKASKTLNVANLEREYVCGYFSLTQLHGNF